mgnify:CR=1 FL=1
MNRIAVFALAVLMGGAANVHAESEDDDIPATPVQEYIQVWLGTTDTDESWRLEDSNGAAVKGDFSELPLGGGVAQRLRGQRTQYGYEGGGLISWKSDNVYFAGNSNGLRVAVDTELFMMEMFMGGVIAVRPAQWIRLYAAAGPSIAWGYLDGDGSDDDDTDETSLIVNAPNGFIVIDGNDSANDFSFSLYGRIGLEFEFNNGFLLGVSARYAEHEFDFDERGELNLDEVQWFLTLGGRI